MTTSAGSLHAGEGALNPPPRPTPLGSLLAAAARLTSTKMKGRDGYASISKPEEWQDDAWDMYDLVGEQRFLARTMANRIAQARFFVGRMPNDPTEDVEVVEPGHLAYRIFDAMNGRGHTINQLASRLGLNLLIPGDGWVVGIPRTVQGPDLTRDGIAPIGQDEGTQGVDIEDLRWSFMSLQEVSRTNTGKIRLTGQNADPDREYDPDELFMIRVWQPHPREWVKADSPTRSSLPVLRELVGLTMHISAQVDSRLAGAGVFLIPQSADDAVRAQMGDEALDEEESPFAAALMEAMTTPISDRSSAAAVVPFMPVVPDDSVEKFRHLSFASALDAEARELRDEAIRRLALGQDCPPELLLGVAGMNHWGAWLVREDVVTTHLEPPLALICDALTTQYLWVVMEAQGIPEEEYRQYVIWYDVDHLITRPSLSSDAKDLYNMGAISEGSLRDAIGFDESDAPAEVEKVQNDPAVEAALQLATAAPSLAQNPGLPALVEQIRALYADAPDSEESVEVVDVPVEEETDDAEPPSDDSGQGPPDPEESTGPEDVIDDMTASGSPLRVETPQGMQEFVPEDGQGDGEEDD